MKQGTNQHNYIHMVTHYKTRQIRSRSPTMLSIHLVLLPSALARGFELGIYSHDMRTYVRMCPSRLGMSR